MAKKNNKINYFIPEMLHYGIKYYSPIFWSKWITSTALYISEYSEKFRTRDIQKIFIIFVNNNGHQILDVEILLD